MINRKSRYCLGIAITACITTTAFAQTQSSQQNDKICEYYLTHTTQESIPQKDLNVLQECNSNGSCEDESSPLYSIPDCSRKLNTLLGQAPAPIPIPNPYAPKPAPKKPLPAWEAAIEPKKAETAPTTPPPPSSPVIQSNENADDSSVSTPPAQTSPSPPTTPTPTQNSNSNSNSNSKPTINWF